MKLTFLKTVALIKQDLYRQCTGKLFFMAFLSSFIFYPGFKTIVIYRICKWMKRSWLFKWNIYIFFRYWLHRCHINYGIAIPLDTEIGGGFRIDHFGGIFICPGLKIGKNCSLSYDVAFGLLPRGIKMGVPVSIGDNVFISPGVKILGKLTIGDDVVIGANSVVLKDIPSNSTVLGIPARVVSNEGAEDYIKIRV